MGAEIEVDQGQQGTITVSETQSNMSVVCPVVPGVQRCFLEITNPPKRYFVVSLKFRGTNTKSIWEGPLLKNIVIRAP